MNDRSAQVTWQGSQHRGCLMESCFIPKVQSPTQSYRRPNSAGFRAEWHLLWCNILFLYTHFLFINTILLQHISWQGPAEPEHFEYLPNCLPGASLQAYWEKTFGFGLDRNFRTFALLSTSWCSLGSCPSVQYESALNEELVIQGRSYQGPITFSSSIVCV